MDDAVFGSSVTCSRWERACGGARYYSCRLPTSLSSSVILVFVSLVFSFLVPLLCQQWFLVFSYSFSGMQ